MKSILILSYHFCSDITEETFARIPNLAVCRFSLPILELLLEIWILLKHFVGFVGRKFRPCSTLLSIIALLEQLSGSLSVCLSLTCTFITICTVRVQWTQPDSTLFPVDKVRVLSFCTRKMLNFNDTMYLTLNNNSERLPSLMTVQSLDKRKNYLQADASNLEVLIRSVSMDLKSIACRHLMFIILSNVKYRICDILSEFRLEMYLETKRKHFSVTPLSCGNFSCMSAVRVAWSPICKRIYQVSRIHVLRHSI